MRNLGVWQALAIASQIGVVFAVTVALGLLGGLYIDSVLRFSPMFTILGALVGVASGVYGCVQTVRLLQRSGWLR